MSPTSYQTAPPRGVPMTLPAPGRAFQLDRRRPNGDAWSPGPTGRRPPPTPPVPASPTPEPDRTSQPPPATATRSAGGPANPSRPAQEPGRAADRDRAGVLGRK